MFDFEKYVDPPTTNPGVAGCPAPLGNPIPDDERRMPFVPTDVPLGPMSMTSDDGSGAGSGTPKSEPPSDPLPEPAAKDDLESIDEEVREILREAIEDDIANSHDDLPPTSQASQLRSGGRDIRRVQESKALAALVDDEERLRWFSMLVHFFLQAKATLSDVQRVEWGWRVTKSVMLFRDRLSQGEALLRPIPGPVLAACLTDLRLMTFWSGRDATFSLEKIREMNKEERFEYANTVVLKMFESEIGEVPEACLLETEDVARKIPGTRSQRIIRPSHPPSAQNLPPAGKYDQERIFLGDGSPSADDADQSSMADSENETSSETSAGDTPAIDGSETSDSED